MRRTTKIYIYKWYIRIRSQWEIESRVLRLGGEHLVCASLSHKGKVSHLAPPWHTGAMIIIRILRTIPGWCQRWSIAKNWSKSNKCLKLRLNLEQSNNLRIPATFGHTHEALVKLRWSRSLTIIPIQSRTCANIHIHRLLSMAFFSTVPGDDHKPFYSDTHKHTWCVCVTLNVGHALPHAQCSTLTCWSKSRIAVCVVAVAVVISAFVHRSFSAMICSHHTHSKHTHAIHTRKADVLYAPLHIHSAIYIYTLSCTMSPHIHAALTAKIQPFRPRCKCDSNERKIKGAHVKWVSHAIFRKTYMCGRGRVSDDHCNKRIGMCCLCVVSFFVRCALVWGNFLRMSR